MHTGCVCCVLLWSTIDLFQRYPPCLEHWHAPTEATLRFMDILIAFIRWKGTNKQNGAQITCTNHRIQIYTTRVSKDSITPVLSSLIARFMGPTWGPPGADRTFWGYMCTTQISRLSVIDSLCPYNGHLNISNVSFNSKYVHQGVVIYP